MLEDRAALREFKQKFEDNGFTISALSSHGNPLHPDRDVARAYAETSRRTIRLAEKLGVPVVIDFSGCPGDHDGAKYPNWVTCPWPPEYLDVLAWQWEKKVEPYWTRQAKFAAEHGVKIAIEMHPGFVVYSPETMLRLRQIAGPSIGCNYDPSHMFWQGIDPIKAIRVLATRFFTCMPRTRRFMKQICRKPAFSIRKNTPMSAIAPGFSAPADTGMRTPGGRSSFRRCACSATITFCRSNMKTRSCRPAKDWPRRRPFSIRSSSGSSRRRRGGCERRFHRHPAGAADRVLARDPGGGRRAARHGRDRGRIAGRGESARRRFARRAAPDLVHRADRGRQRERPNRGPRGERKRRVPCVRWRERNRPAHLRHLLRSCGAIGARRRYRNGRGAQFDALRRSGLVGAADIARRIHRHRDVQCDGAGGAMAGQAADARHQSHLHVGAGTGYVPARYGDDDGRAESNLQGEAERRENDPRRMGHGCGGKSDYRSGGRNPRLADAARRI